MKKLKQYGFEILLGILGTLFVIMLAYLLIVMPEDVMVYFWFPTLIRVCLM